MEAGNIETIYGDDEYTAGDFRSEDSINYLKEADIVVTNPPFSLFREYISINGTSKNLSLSETKTL